jgi:anaerobic ribonucleoside-triphosphate reductase
MIHNDTIALFVWTVYIIIIETIHEGHHEEGEGNLASRQIIINCDKKGVTLISRILPYHLLLLSWMKQHIKVSRQKKMKRVIW